MVNIIKNAAKTKIIAFVSIFTALYTVLRLIPTMPMIGASGATFSLSDIIAPLYGVILGPYIGGLSIILGTFLAMALGKPVVFMFLDFLPATVGAVALGLLIKRKWAPVVVLNIVLLALFLIHPLTSIFVDIPLGSTSFSFPFAWLHIVAFVVLLSPLRRKAVQWVNKLVAAKIATGLAILVFIGTMIQHLMGNLLYECILGQLLGLIPPEAYPDNWTVIFPLYPIERLALVALAVVVGTPLLKVLKNSFLLAEK